MGVFVALLSAVLAASKDVLSKRLAGRVDGTASTFASFAYALPFYVLLLAGLRAAGVEELTLAPAFLTLVLLRATTDTFAEWLKMYALAHGDLSLVATVFSMSPLFLLVTSPLIVGDPVTWEEAAAVVLVVGGSLGLVYRPTAKGWGEQRKGILLAAGASLFFSLNTCFDKLAVQKGTPVFAGFAMTLVSAAFLAPFVAVNRERILALKSQPRVLWGRGFLEVAFMSCKLFAMQYLSPPEAVGLQRLSLLLTIFSGHVFFKEQDFGRRFAAGVLILGGVVWIAWRNVQLQP